MPEPAERASLAERLDRLFRTVHPAGRGEYSHEEAATAIRESGTPISHSYIWQLRKGIKDNPTKRHLEGLAGFFGVPISYFFDEDTSAIDAQLDMLATLRDNPAQRLALRAADLSPGGFAAIRAMVEHARAVEGLPADARGDSEESP
jgi:transcriptional regulator with XRE-family HTH domain